MEACCPIKEILIPPNQAIGPMSKGEGGQVHPLGKICMANPAECDIVQPG